MVRVRHYTRVSAMRKILYEQRLIARDRNRVFVEPAESRRLSATDAEKRYALLQGRGNAYVEFDATDDELRRDYNLPSRAWEYSIEGGVDLTGRNAEGFLNF